MSPSGSILCNVNVKYFLTTDLLHFVILWDLQIFLYFLGPGYPYAAFVDKAVLAHDKSPHLTVIIVRYASIQILCVSI